MNVSSALAFVAAVFCCLLALAAVIRKRHSFSSWCFAVGMMLFAIESLLTGFSFRTTSAETIAFLQTLGLLTKSFLPGVWLAFSVTYSRANYREFLARSRFLLALAFLLPIFVSPAVYTPVLGVRPYESPAIGWMVEFGETAKILNALILVSAVLILMNFERTFRSAVGTMRWRIKFLILGVIVIFGARIYTRSQTLLFSGYDLAQSNIETAAVLLGCILMGIGYMRSGFSEIEIYPSRAVLRTSLTLLLAGGYLFIVGILAQVVRQLGDASRFPLAAFLVLLALALLGVLLLSDRLRLRIELFVSRHFKRPEHDFRQIWTRFTKSLSAVLDETNLCATSARLISEIFSALSVSVWLLDDKQQRLISVFSTAESNERTSDRAIDLAPAQLGSIVSSNDSRPFELEKADKQSREQLGKIGAGRFPAGGNRICVPLRAGEQNLGLLVLADRVNAIYYTPEEVDLLKCIGDDIAASLLNLRLTREILEQKELEAFQTMSAFFIHDLKNAASTLGLTLQNLPTHFDDPEFRKDALRGIKGAADRINDIVGRLGTLRQELRSKPTEVDLNSLVMEKVKGLDGVSSAEVVTNLEALPPIVADREQLGSVITNLILNAKEAVGVQGRITIETKKLDQTVALSVSDNGCGMTVEFLKDSLFRPFHTTKKRGLGIGMFQAKMIVEAHRGNIRVNSAPGAGTTFQITLPLSSNGK